MKKQIRSLDHEQMQGVVDGFGEKSFRAKQLYEWVHKRRIDDWSLATNLSKDFRNRLSEEYSIDPLKVIKKQVSADGGTAKYLFELEDGETIESVWMHYRHGDSICVSSQVGCRMGCSFCASTIGGLVRNLTPAEMLSQVYDIERDIYQEHTDDRASMTDDVINPTKEMNDDPASRGFVSSVGGERRTGEGHIGSIIVMGMGEPFDNYDNLISFIRLLTDKDGRNLSARGVTVSTCGIPDGIRRLADEDLPITLALSLHAPNDDIRRRIMPIAKAHPMDEVFGACREYFSETGRRITFEYSMISGINDTADAARELAKRCDSLKKAGCMLHVNLIPLNEVSETGLNRAGSDNIQRFKRVLEDNGITVTVRREMGAGIDAACGQLRHKEKRV